MFQASIAQTLDNAIRRIIHYPVNKYYSLKQLALFTW